MNYLVSLDKSTLPISIGTRVTLLHSNTGLSKMQQTTSTSSTKTKKCSLRILTIPKNAENKAIPPTC